MFENVDDERFIDSLQLWTNVVNSKSFENCSVVLFFNKLDIFKEKYMKKKIPLPTSCNEFEKPPLIEEEETLDMIRQSGEISMGSDITENDFEYIRGLGEQIIVLFEHRDKLEEYIQSRMQQVAPNLSAVIGEMIAAKLIAKSGSVINLAKCSASTIQIMGAEKALFKAIRAKKKTPKYGIIY